MIAKNDNNALMIPQDATVQVQDKIFVYKVDANGKIHYSEIKVDPQNDGVNYVVTSGLKIGERIVSKGLATLEDGMEIKPLTPCSIRRSIEESCPTWRKSKFGKWFLEGNEGQRR